MTIGDKFCWYISILSDSEIELLTFLLRKKDKQLVLFETIVKKKILNKRDLFNIIYKDKYYNDGLIRSLLHELNRTIEEVLIFKEIQKNDNLRNATLLTFLSKNTKKDGYYLDKYDQLKNEFKNEGLLLLKINYDYYNFISRRDRTERTLKLIKEIAEDIDGASDYIKLIIHLDICSSSNLFIMDTEYKKKTLKLLKKEFNESIYKIECEILKDLILLILGITNDFLKIRDHFYFNLIHIESNKEFLKIVYGSLVNYCIKMLNKGNKQFEYSLFELYQHQLNRNLLFSETNNISVFTFRNIVSIGLINNSFDWVEDFIYKYKDFIPKPDKENTINISLSNLYFHKGDFKTCVSFINSIKFTDDFTNAQSRMLTIKIFLLENEFIPVENSLLNFKLFLKRKIQLANYHKEGYLNFIKVIEYWLKRPQIKKSDLNELINKHENIKDKKWLMDFFKLSQ